MRTGADAGHGQSVSTSEPAPLRQPDLEELPLAGMALIEGRDDVVGTLDAIRHFEHTGVPMVWTTLGPRTPDAPTLLAAAAATTARIGLGTAIVPTYPRHPAVLASQVLVLARVAPGRFRLGIGPSHQSIMERLYGLSMGRPLAHLREYLHVLRDLLWTGRVDFDGIYYSVHLALDEPLAVPLYVSALRPHAFELAGELSDGVISWLCPITYLRERAIPAMERGARRAQRTVPRLVAQVPVVMSADRAVMLDAARPEISVYSNLPFYAAMFERAGLPAGLGGVAPDALIEQLVVWGTDADIEDRLRYLLGDGIDELAVTLIAAQEPAAESMRLARVVARIGTNTGSPGAGHSSG